MRLDVLALLSQINDYSFPSQPDMAARTGSTNVFSTANIRHDICLPFVFALDELLRCALESIESVQAR